jgi:hypothetical protein
MRLEGNGEDVISQKSREDSVPRKKEGPQWECHREVEGEEDKNVTLDLVTWTHGVTLARTVSKE